MLIRLSCNPRFQRRADHLHSLGSRAVGESLAELAQGKKLWRPIITVCAHDVRARWQCAVLAALTAAGIGGAP